MVEVSDRLCVLCVISLMLRWVLSVVICCVIIEWVSLSCCVMVEKLLSLVIWMKRCIVFSLFIVVILVISICGLLVILM